LPTAAAIADRLILAETGCHGKFDIEARPGLRLFGSTPFRPPGGRMSIGRKR